MKEDIAWREAEKKRLTAQAQAEVQSMDLVTATSDVTGKPSPLFTERHRDIQSLSHVLQSHSQHRSPSDHLQDHLHESSVLEYVEEAEEDDHRYDDDDDDDDDDDGDDDSPYLSKFVRQDHYNQQQEGDEREVEQELNRLLSSSSSSSSSSPSSASPSMLRGRKPSLAHIRPRPLDASDKFDDVISVVATPVTSPPPPPHPILVKPF